MLAAILITIGVLLMVGVCASILGGLTTCLACLLAASGSMMPFFSAPQSIGEEVFTILMHFFGGPEISVDPPFKVFWSNVYDLPVEIGNYPPNLV